MSELELSILRQRSLEALKQKAKRGELFLTVAVGYVKTRHDRIEKDPDRRVQEAISLVFRKFAEFHSIRQVHLWLRQEHILLPSVNYGIDAQRRIEWKLPVYNSVHHILTNPVYAGAYAFGRTGSRVSIEQGRKRVTRGFRKAREDWDVLLLEQHEGYISWMQYERNQQLIADNIPGDGGARRGAVREGKALLAGLLRCGHCGRKLHTAYSGAGGTVPRYHCRGAMVNHGTKGCISFGAVRVDEAVGTEVLNVLQPFGIEAALRAIEIRETASGEKRAQMEHALEQARYEAVLARRQYDAVDPENRLVAAELENRWNMRLVAVRELEDELDALEAARQPSLSEHERARLMEIGSDVAQAWNHPQATPATRKRILRTVLHEIVAKVEPDDHIHLVLHWQGGDHTSLKVRKNKTGQHRWATPSATLDLVRELSRLLPDKAIASLLNRIGKRTGRDNTWTQSRVVTLRNQHGIDVYREGERAERGELTLAEAAERLGVSKMTVLRLIRDEVVAAHQCCRGAPWVIKEESLEGIELKSASGGGRKRPLTPNPDQKVMSF